MNFKLTITDKEGNPIQQHVFGSDEIRRTLVFGFLVDERQADLAINIVARDAFAVYDLSRFDDNGEQLLWSARLERAHPLRRGTH